MEFGREVNNPVIILKACCNLTACNHLEMVKNQGSNWVQMYDDYKQDILAENPCVYCVSLYLSLVVAISLFYS